ncbi:MAG: ATP-binding cassette domain-containing protein [Sphaerochaeta sp.]|jgi:putative ABC transport system ATP-binding protein|uniref:Methionine import ATP-binding protein MetN n=1 Tax=bioreactor metagenome TaxID=1076179 RepID=A0A644WNW2_9ZZZZ|nr:MULTISPECIES: ATP-binding cassette domain-containing protein [Sphaerochaeta]MDT3357894.1 ATP-binding cassette domain-containing protein [Spirochaetota bacterium]NLA96666.1 ATP-binding cassette domain-containing protein [Spirochaetales bacterium]MDD2394237.1 ATP-binding cassette domain-containing protein [Sphaerochaeta sp.]MDD3422952.1 ATP-binding cassette domain-containing protein [Sphaerochaeta sp.]MDD4037441.1 ATP-binding cassette domain-containing protein [Sphaerochaeta sp.]
MLDLSNITKVFYPGTVNEKMALDNINLHVNKGDVICVVGSNGSGKSTLFNLISGTYPVTNGKIIFDGTDVTASPEYKRAMTIGRIFQDPTKGTAANMSIEDNMITAETKGMKGLRISLNNEKREQFASLLKLIGLQDRLKDNVGLLSGGQRQALTLLMTVMSRPKMLLLDEHTAALDPRNAQIVMDLTERFIAEYKLTALMVTHNMQFAINFGNRLIMMDEGTIILDVSGEEKSKLTVEELVRLFKNLRNKTYANDEALLTKE